jgi:hypothetical protein
MLLILSKIPHGGISESAQPGILSLLSRYYVFRNDTATDNMAFHNAAGCFRIYFAIGNFGLITDDNMNDGFFVTLANASSLGDDDSINVLIFDDFEDCFHCIPSAGGDSTRAHTNDYLRLPRGSFNSALFESFVSQFF